MSEQGERPSLGPAIALDFTAVLTRTRAAIVATDPQGNITLFSPAAQRLLDCPENEALGTSISRFCPEELRADQSELLRRVWETGTGRSVVTERQTADDTRVPVRMTLVRNPSPRHRGRPV